MKTKDKIIAFAVLIAAVINTYECAKKIKRDIDNWAETTTIAKNINVENINDIIMDNIIYNNELEDDPIGIIKELNMETLLKLIKKIDISNASEVIVKK